MSIRHVVLFRFHEGTDRAAVEALAEGLRRLPAAIPEIVDYHVGPALGLTDDSWDFAVSAEFASVEDLATYRAHPDHQAVVRDLITPITAERHSVQFTG